MRDRFGPQLVAVPFQRGDIDGPGLDRPEAASAGGGLQVRILVRGGGKDTPAGHNDSILTIQWPVAVRAAGYEHLDVDEIYWFECAQLGYFDPPDSVELDGGILSANIW